MAHKELEDPVECSSFARKVMPAVAPSQLMKQKQFGKQHQLLPSPQHGACGLPPRHQVFPFSTACALWLRALSGWGDDILLPTSDDIPLSCCPASLPGSPRAAARWGEDQTCWDKRSCSPLGKACRCLAQHQPPESKTRRVCRGQTGHADH